MSTLAQAEAAYFVRLDAAYQHKLDAYDKALSLLDECRTLGDLDDYGFEPTLIDSIGAFDLYQINIGAGDDDKYLICRDCGLIAVSHLSGCQNCGFGSNCF